MYEYRRSGTTIIFWSDNPGMVEGMGEYMKLYIDAMKERYKEEMRTPHLLTDTEEEEDE